MLPKQLSSEKKFSPSLNKNLTQIFKKDELITLINKLSEIIKNFTKILKNNISKKKEEISFIDNKTDFSYNIVNNIIKHNYSYGQLKLLGESLIKIREKNNNNQINVLNEEQNLLLFLEQSDKFFKAIIKKQKQNIQRNIKNYNPPSANNTYYNYSLPFNKNGRGNLLNPYLQNDINYKQKRNKSAGNSRNKKASSNIEMNNIKIKRVLNANSKKNNLTPLIYKPKSSYNIDINNIDIFKNNNYNSSSLRISPTKIIVDYQNLSSTIELMKRHDIINKKTIQNLNKEIENYKKLIEIFSKNHLYEEINFKNKPINYIPQGIDNKNKKIDYYLNRYSKKHRNIKKNKILENMNVNLEKIETEPHNNTSYSFNFTENIKNYPMILMQKEKQIKHLKQEKYKLEKYIKEQNKYINEENLIKSKLNKNVIKFNDKNKELEIEIHKLNEQLKNEIFKNEKFQQQKIKYEIEISTINDKKEELSKYLANKNNEIIKLQKELVEKNKEFEIFKLSVKNNIDKTENIIIEKNKKELELINSINKMKNDNEKLYQQNEKRNNEIIELNKTINQYKYELSKKKEEINKIQNINNNKINELNKINNETITLNNINNNLNEEIKKLKEENEGLKEFIYKSKEKEEKMIDKYHNQKEKLSFLQKENEIYKQYFLDKNISVPSQDLNKKKLKSEEDDKNINILEELNKAKKEINILKKKNEQLFNELESKKFEDKYHDNFSEGKIVSNYEEEFDLRKMAKGAIDKNRSQDINIDYPGAQQVKEKYRELDFYYNSLEELVKKLLLNCTCTNKNKLYISELCKIVGFEEDVTYKIVNNKSKKGINIFGQY